IEIQGLIKAFGKNTAKKQFCALGSVKSNIGHAESAAGISGMTKAILQLHHKQLVPSIHCDPINPHLNLETSPFYVQKENEEWNPEQGVRRAGISSFGATGSNAHVILEEFHQEETIRKELETPVLLPLSAKTQERLQAYVLKLLDFIQMNQHEIDLPSMAYTLQTGRQDMDERFVVLAGSIDEVIEKLKEFVKKPEQASGIWCGNINSENTLLRFFQSDGDLKDAVEQWLLKGKLNKVAELWVQGCEMEWELLYEEERPLRMSLPTYPFTRERYWVNVDVNRPAVQVDPETKDVKIEVRLPESMEAGRTNSSKNNNNVASLGRANKKAAETNNTQSGGLAAQTKGIEKVDTKAHIREIVASTIKLKPEQVLYNKALYEYGVDSIIFMKLNNFFEENFDTTFTMTEWDEKWSIEQIFQELEKKAGDLSLKTVGPTETVQEVKDLAPRKSASHSGSIPKVTREHYPLSSTQKSLYFLYLSAPKEPFYNMSVTYQLTGELNELALKQTLEEIIDRHDALKTKFVLVKGEAFQTVPEENQLEIKQVDLHDLAESERKQRLDQELYDESLQAFDLEKELPIRALLIRTGSNEHYLRLTSHHIVFDGWSMGVFSYEFGALYNAFANGRPSPLSPLPVQYPDYAVYQQETLLTARDYPQHLEFWKEKLKSVTNGTLLPADREREGNVGFEGGTLVFTLEKEKVERLRKLGSENSASLFMTLLAAFQTLLFRYTGDNDIVIGSPIANRLTTDLERMIGFFANSLVMRGQLLDYMSFTDLLDETRKMVKEAYEHKDVPFEALVAELKPERNINFNPFFQIAFVLQNAPFQELEMHELTVNRLDDQAPKVRFDLEVNLFETDGAIEGFFNYRTSLFEKERIERLMEHYGNLLDAILADTNTPLIKLRFLGKEEQEQSAIKIDQIKRDPVAEVASTPSESIEFERGTI
ncbi:MAG: condensation domain-containing protein, partial [Proteobacteria bacterium]|nr:condensation domain-containing protein [Pseudomonadota bacterium]